MSIKRFVVALGAILLIAIAAAPSMAQAANPSSGTPPTIPQVASATNGAVWLSQQLTSSGFIPMSGNPAQADLSGTANTVLALASAGDDTSATKAFNYLAGHVNDYVSVNGSDGPGQLALLILDAHALRVDPTSFGGSDLVTRLLATEQLSGPDAGLFGVQDATFDGAFRQGLSLSALAAVDVNGTAAVRTADSWLEAQQCPDGGWTSLITATNPCNGNPASFAGPDTNSTAQAIQGLSTQGALSVKGSRLATKFIRLAQDPDGGWGFEPNATNAPGTSDPDSTALVIQAILALGKSPSSASFLQGGTNPVSSLLAFQLTSGTGSGSFVFPGSTAPNLVATYQAVPAVAGVTDPFNLAITTSSLPVGTERSSYAVIVTASGGAAPYRWKLVKGAGTLPIGLRLNPSSGTISGKPRSAGTSSFAIEVFAANSASSPPTQAIAWRVLSITISAAT
jgi:hypothetical protein